MGRPITLEEAGYLLMDPEYRVIGFNELPATRLYVPSFLSTVWLGLDHSLFVGPPIIFETMRFALDRKGGFHPVLEFPAPDDGEMIEQWRYSTEEQASLGHKLILKLIHESEGT
jgi:hypothetical protein